MRSKWGSVAWVICFAHAAACVGDPPNTSGDASDAAAPDAAVDGSTGIVDAGVDAADASLGLCDAKAPFTSSAIVANVNSQAGEFVPSLTPDEKTIFFEAYRTGDASTATTSSIFTSSRASASGTFAPATSVVELNSAGNNGGPWIMPGNLTLYMISSRGGPFQIYVTTRLNPVAVFPLPSLVANINTGNDFNASLSPDASEMFFGTSRSGPFRMYRAVSSGGNFGAPTEVTELTTAVGATHGIANPALSASGLELYFTVSQNTDFSGTVAVWVAERASKSDPFSDAHAVTEVNADGQAQAGWISPDLCRLYVTQIRASGGVGASDIFMYTRSPN